MSQLQQGTEAERPARAANRRRTEPLVERTPGHKRDDARAPAADVTLGQGWVGCDACRRWWRVPSAPLLEREVERYAWARARWSSRPETRVMGFEKCRGRSDGDAEARRPPRTVPVRAATARELRGGRGEHAQRGGRVSGRTDRVRRLSTVSPRQRYARHVVHRSTTGVPRTLEGAAIGHCFDPDPTRGLGRRRGRAGACVGGLSFALVRPSHKS